MVGDPGVQGVWRQLGAQGLHICEAPSFLPPSCPHFSQDLGCSGVELGCWQDGSWAVGPVPACQGQGQLGSVARTPLSSDHGAGCSPGRLGPHLRAGGRGS